MPLSSRLVVNVIRHTIYLFKLCSRERKESFMQAFSALITKAASILACWSLVCIGEEQHTEPSSPCRHHSSDSKLSLMPRETPLVTTPAWRDGEYKAIFLYKHSSYFIREGWIFPCSGLTCTWESTKISEVVRRVRWSAQPPPPRFPI